MTFNTGVIWNFAVIFMSKHDHEYKYLDTNSWQAWQGTSPCISTHFGKCFPTLGILFTNVVSFRVACFNSFYSFFFSNHFSYARFELELLIHVFCSACIRRLASFSVCTSVCPSHVTVTFGLFKKVTHLSFGAQLCDLSVFLTRFMSSFPDV